MAFKDIMIPSLKMIFGFSGLLTILFLFASVCAAAESPNEIRSFADSLYRQEDYYRAITEYKHFLHFYPKHPQSRNISLSIGFAYLKGEKYAAALPYFQKLSADRADGLSEEAHFLMGQSYFLEKRFDTALDEWRQFLSRKPRRFKDAAHYQIGSSYLFNDKVSEAREELSKIRDPKLKKRSENFIQAMNRWENRPTRSPTFAGILSALLPGAGQSYNGHFWDGLSALVINGAFAYGAYYTFTHDHTVAGGLLTLIGSGFYGGNIFSAVSGAHKYNKRVKASLWEEFQTKYGIIFEWNGNLLTPRF